MSEMTKSTDNAEAIDWDDAFVRAANKKDYRAMEDALGKGANIDVSNVRGITPLHSAVLSRNLGMVAWLAKRGASPALKTFVGDTALHDAAKLADPGYLRELLQAKSTNVNVVNSLGSSPLMEAAGGRFLDNVKQLVEAGALVNQSSKRGGTSALLIAAGKHDHDTVNFLLSNGANPNDADFYGVTALISAAAVYASLDGGDEGPQIASQKTMAELLRAGADVNLAAKSGNTALAESSRCMNKRGMLLLIDADANPNVRSTAGTGGELTPLMVAAYKNDLELIEKLLDRGASVGYANKKGHNALMMCMMGPLKNEEQQAKACRAIEALFRAGATLDHEVDGQIGLASYAVLTESKELLKLAQEHGGLDQRGEGGATAVFYATSVRKADMLRELSGLGANFDATNEAGQNALHLLAGAPYPAAILQAIQMMLDKNDEKLQSEAEKLRSQMKASAMEFTTMLLNLGAGINARDKEGNTPLHAALAGLADGLADRAYIDFLVGKGADIALRNDLEDSPFVVSIKMGNFDLAETWARSLVGSGRAEMVERAVYDVSWAPPELASQVAAMKKVLDGLKKHGANASYQDDDGQFPLLIAASTNQEDLVNALIEMGVDVNQRNHDGEVAAFHSVKENHPNITSILFDKGCNPDSVRADGESLVSIAYRHQNATAVRQIVECRHKWLAAGGWTAEPGVAAEAQANAAPKKMGM